MNKLQKVISEKDFLKAKRLILDNPKYLEENVDLVLSVVAEIGSIKEEVLRQQKEISNILKEKNWEISRKNMTDRMKKEGGRMFHSIMNNNGIPERHLWDKERAHEQAIRINEFQNSFYTVIQQDVSLPVKIGDGNDLVDPKGISIDQLKNPLGDQHINLNNYP